MKMQMGLALVSIALVASSAQAQVGRLVKEGAEAAGKRVLGRAAREATEEGAEQLLKRGAAKAIRAGAQETVEAAAKRAGLSAAQYTDDAVRAIGRHGPAVAAPMVKRFGDDGAKALVKLSPANARRMAMVSEELAASGHGADWMRVLADKGDVVAEWIWKNKGTIAIATVSTAFLANPDSFLQAGEAVATKGIETAGQHVAQPLIEKAVGELAPRVGVSVVETTGKHPFLLLVMALFASAGGWFGYRWWVHEWLPKTRS